MEYIDFKRRQIHNIRMIKPSYIDLSMVDINGNNLPARETANCYVIKSVGSYAIPLVYGNAITNGAINTASYTQIVGTYTSPFYNYINNQITSPYIETDTNVMASSCEVLLNDSAGFTISNLEIIDGSPCRYIKFDVTSVPPLGGNITLGVKDSLGQVMWSWHLWAYPYTLSTKAHTNTYGYTYNFLDVNLGWVKHAADSKYGTCPFFQWGRKDPMLRPKVYNSNTQASIAQGSFSITTCATSLASTIQNPNIFNKYETTNYNWWKNGDSVVNFYNYWDASSISTECRDNAVAKTIYDPSPVGFHVPNGNTFLGFSTSNGGTWDYGWTWDSRYFPAAGSRSSNSGGVSSVGGYGHYWSSASNSVRYAYRLYFISGDINPQGRSYRAAGYAVAPVAY